MLVHPSRKRAVVWRSPAEVHVSFMELYNEELRDLLDKDASTRQVGEDSKRRARSRHFRS